MNLKGKYRDIEYVSSWNSDGVSIWWEALLFRDGTPFLRIGESEDVRGCSSNSFRAFVAQSVERSIEGEIALAESGQHFAGRFLVPVLTQD